MQSGAAPYTDFAVHVAPSAGGGTEVTIYGELDLATVEHVRTAFAEAVEAEGPVAVDLRACGFVDSRGIGALIELALRLRDQGRSLTLRGVQARIMRTLEVAGLAGSELLQIEEEPKADTG